MSADAVRQDPRMVAGLALLGRTGARSVRIGYHDDEEPVVWFACAEYQAPGDPRSGNPARRAATPVHEAAGAMTPVLAVLRLCEQLVDGGRCTHCSRPAGLEPDSIETMPLDDLVCWYQFDPELETFRRGCEGDQ